MACSPITFTVDYVAGGAYNLTAYANDPIVCLAYKFKCTALQSACTQDDVDKGMIKLEFTMVTNSTCTTIMAANGLSISPLCCNTNRCNSVANYTAAFGTGNIGQTIFPNVTTNATTNGTKNGTLTKSPTSGAARAALMTRKVPPAPARFSPPTACTRVWETCAATAPA